VAAIPVSAFYAERAVTNLVRFCFAKRDATLDAALERLRDLARTRGLRPGGALAA
jgi:aspartate/methionine/tyrosine aminotransferase